MAFLLWQVRQLLDHVDGRGHPLTAALPRFYGERGRLLVSITYVPTQPGANIRAVRQHDGLPAGEPMQSARWSDL